MKAIVYQILVLVLFISCSSKQEKLVLQIEQLQEEMALEEFPSKSNMERIIALYDEYVTTYPKDSLVYSYYELKAKYEAANGQYQDALKTYTYITTQFNDDKRTPENLYMMAFIYDNHLGDKKNAENLYKKIIHSYPHHDLVDDAQFSLENLYISEEDLIKMLEEKEKFK